MRAASSFVRASVSRAAGCPHSIQGLESFRMNELVLGCSTNNWFNDKEEVDSMPEVGDMAPDFELKSHLEKDKKVKLSDFRGKKNVVIAFYPLAWTPV